MGNENSAVRQGGDTRVVAEEAISFQVAVSRYLNFRHGFYRVLERKWKIDNFGFTKKLIERVKPLEKRVNSSA